VRRLEQRAGELRGEIEQLQQDEEQTREEARERHTDAKQVNEARIEILKVSFTCYPST